MPRPGDAERRHERLRRVGGSLRIVLVARPVGEGIEEGNRGAHEIHGARPDERRADFGDDGRGDRVVPVGGLSGVPRAAPGPGAIGGERQVAGRDGTVGAEGARDHAGLRVVGVHPHLDGHRGHDRVPVGGERDVRVVRNAAEAVFGRDHAVVHVVDAESARGLVDAGEAARRRVDVEDAFEKAHAGSVPVAGEGARPRRSGRVVEVELLAERHLMLADDDRDVVVREVTSPGGDKVQEEPGRAG